MRLKYCLPNPSRHPLIPKTTMAMAMKTRRFSNSKMIKMMILSTAAPLKALWKMWMITIGAWITAWAMNSLSLPWMKVFGRVLTRPHFQNQNQIRYQMMMWDDEVACPFGPSRNLLTRRSTRNVCCSVSVWSWRALIIFLNFNDLVFDCCCWIDKAWLSCLERGLAPFAIERGDKARSAREVEEIRMA